MSSHWEVMNSGAVSVPNSPQEMWDRGISYLKWCDEHPIEIQKSIYVGAKAGTKYTESRIRPYSIKGLCMHLGIMEEYLRDIRNTKDKTSLYFIVVSKLLYLIYVQAHEMATIGEFNPIFTAKVLNMDKDDVIAAPIKIEIVQGLPELAKSENEILERLEKEITDI